MPASPTNSTEYRLEERKFLTVRSLWMGEEKWLESLEQVAHRAVGSGIFLRRPVFVPSLRLSLIPELQFQFAWPIEGRSAVLRQMSSR